MKHQSSQKRSAALRYVHDTQPGIRRIRKGKTFSYRRPDGTAVRDNATLRRIRSLVIPPAWTDVWICTDPRGHLQATGRDKAGRKQYRYHPQWKQERSTAKFHRLIPFARLLPRIRRSVRRDLRRQGLSRERILAVVVTLLEQTMIRVGNEAYARAHRSFGLTTLRNRHADIHGADVTFHFRGKSGVCHRVSLHDPRLARIIRRCQELPGQHLFEYRDESGTVRSIASHDVNAYLRDITGLHITAKDFRTWMGTVLAAMHLSACPIPGTQRAIERITQETVRAVAEKLGNTPTVCRGYYIHPGILSAFQAGSLQCITPRHRQGLSKMESIVLEAIHA